jgi:hypothetical protein
MLCRWRDYLWPVIGLACLMAGQANAEVLSQVDIANGDQVVDHSKSIAQITQAQSSGGWPAQYGLGLFINNIEFELSIANAASPGGALAITTRIKTKPTIFIASELPSDSCSYAVVLEHEMMHYRFDLEVLHAMPDQIRTITHDAFPDNRALSAQAIEQAKSLCFQRIKYVYGARSFPQHVTIDNPASYEKLGKSCQGEIGQRLNKALTTR